MNTNNLHVIGRVISTVFRIKEIGVIVVMTRNASVTFCWCLKIASSGINIKRSQAASQITSAPHSKVIASN